MDIVIKTAETREGVMFRILKNDRYFFAELKFQNYFYVKRTDYELIERDLLNAFVKCISKCDVVGQFVKISFANNFMRTKIREFFENQGFLTYEADIKSNKRYLLDKEITLYNEYIPYSFFDIETDDRLPLQKDDKGFVLAKSRILSFAFTDHKGYKVKIKLQEDSDKSEKQFLEQIILELAKYGIICGWNSVKFDMPYIKQRCEALSVNFTILDYINHLDYMEIYKKYSKKTLKSYSLNSVCKHEKIGQKIDQEKGEGKIYNTWKNDPDKLMEYNLEDSNLIYKLNQKLSFIEVSMNVANISGCHLQGTMNESDCMDYLIMREYKAENIVMPSQPNKAEVERRKKLGKIGGGYTNCFKTGYFDKVDVWDLKSTYPSVIREWNIDPMTYVDTIQKEEDALAVDRTKYNVTPSDFENYYHPHRIYLKKEGVIPKCVKKLVEARDKIKYMMDKYKYPTKKDSSVNPDYNPDLYKKLYLEQYALKTCANSIYGILSFPKSRYYSWELGDTVTTITRAVLKQCYKKLVEWGCIVLGGDTDSTFVLLEGQDYVEIDKKFVEFFEEYAKKWYCDTNQLVFEHEKVFEPMFFVMKKNYAYIYNGEAVIKGMECVKSDSNIIAAQLQEKFVMEILHKNISQDWEKKIDELQNRVFEQQLTTQELIMVKALTKMPKEYEGETIDKKTGKGKIKADGTVQMKSIPAHVKLADRMMHQNIDLYPGSKIRYIIVKTKPNLALSPEEFEKGTGMYSTKVKKKGMVEWEFAGQYDAEYYWTRILKPLLKVMYCYYQEIPKYNWNLSDAQIHKLLKLEDDDDE